jgi:prepilin-type N-terminal cleavage/methylation domain-containing protein
MKKRGLTLIELMVAMTIFILVMTLSIGGFVAISKYRVLIGTMKETQQKIRVANEMIIRYSKQAEYASIAITGDSLELFFDIDNATVRSAKKFAVSTDGQNDLLYFECVTPSNSSTSCKDSSGNPNWGTSTSLLGGKDKKIFLSDISDVFNLSSSFPSVLELSLTVSNDPLGYGGDMRIENAIILGNLK